MNIDRNQPVTIGVILIALGVVALFGLWELLLPGVLAVVGAMVYTQRRRANRTIEAVQAGIWLFGLALLFLLDFFWPGILFLAGMSILARGREFQVDDRIQALLGRVRSRRARPSVPAQSTPATPPQVVAPREQESAVTTGETTRL